MGFFDDCRPDQRFSVMGHSLVVPGLPGSDHNWTMWNIVDWDQRRALMVHMKRMKRKATDDSVWDDDDEDPVFASLFEHIDSLLPNTVLIEMSHEGELFRQSCKDEDDLTTIPYYPPLAEFAHHCLEPRIMRRNDLVELDRLGVQVDLTAMVLDMDGSRKLVFKYNHVQTNIHLIWHEINCLMRIPAHPNIVPLESLVIDTLGGCDVVVGYTTVFVPGGTVEDNVGRTFKLKHLEQLLHAIDFLNLELGIVHGDIFLHNLLINPETEDLQIFDFNLASKLGWEGEPRYQMRPVFAYDEERNDVKNAIFTLYELITRDLHFRQENYPEELHVSMVNELEWEKHEEVILDADVAEYRAVLDKWTENRREADKEVTHWTKASRPLDWPGTPKFPETDFSGIPIRTGYRSGKDIKKNKVDYLKWRRPPCSQLPLSEGLVLLATGQVVPAPTKRLDEMAS